MNKYYAISLAIFIALVALLLSENVQAKTNGTEHTYNVWEEAIENYTYVYEAEGQSPHDYTKPFIGDCRSFAVTILVGVGNGVVYFVESKEDEHNLVYSNQGYVWGCDGNVYALGQHPFKIMFKLGGITLK